MQFKFIMLCVLSLAFFSGCDFDALKVDFKSSRFKKLEGCAASQRLDAAPLVSEALCGTFLVSENPENPDSREIGLNIMLLPARAINPKPDPIFFIAGGPGQSAVEMGPIFFTQLPEVLRDRDIVLVDQRGTGKSNSLACELGDTLSFWELDPKNVELIWLSQARACLESLAADTAFYTSSIAAGDLEKVRVFLGFDEINLLGISYGTRVALVYARSYPQHVRSLVLDGVVPQSMRIPENIGVDAGIAFRRLLSDCRAQPSCSQTFPELEEKFDHLLDHLKNEAKVAKIPHPRTGEYRTVRIDEKFLSGVIRNVLYDRTLSTLIPLAIHQAERGDFQVLVSLASIFEMEEASISFGMMASVLCSEDMQHPTKNEVQPEARFGNPLTDQLKTICEFWPIAKVPESFFSAKSIRAPALLLSGELDPVTPPKYAEQARKSLGNSRHLVAAGVGHGVSHQGCVSRIISRFINDPDPNKVDSICVEKMSRKPFFTSLSGPLLNDADVTLSD